MKEKKPRVDLVSDPVKRRGVRGEQFKNIDLDFLINFDLLLLEST